MLTGAYSLIGGLWGGFLVGYVTRAFLGEDLSMPASFTIQCSDCPHKCYDHREHCLICQCPRSWFDVIDGKGADQ